MNLDQIRSSINKVPEFLFPDGKNILNHIEIIFDFREFISLKYNISLKDSESKLSEYLENYDKSDMVTKGVEWAEKEGYTKVSELKESFDYMIKISKKYQKVFTDK